MNDNFPALQYAGFWRRAAAIILDGIIVGVMNKILQLAVWVDSSVSWRDLMGNFGGHHPMSGGMLANFLMGLVVSWLYFSFMESSDQQATWGKKALNLQVTDAHGQRLTFFQATVRHMGKFLSYATLGIGFLMVFWTDRQQALHDKIAGTLVIRKPAAPETDLPPLT